MARFSDSVVNVVRGQNLPETATNMPRNLPSGPNFLQAARRKCSLSLHPPEVYIMTPLPLAPWSELRLFGFREFT